MFLLFITLRVNLYAKLVEVLIIRTEDIDQLTLKKLKGGDIEAFQKIFMAYSDKLFHFAFSYLKSTFDAEEIVQEVFIRIWEMRSDIDEERSFKSFIYRMTVNKVFNHMKHQVVRQKYENYLMHFDQSPGESPEANLHFKELEAKVRSLLMKLPEQQRNIFEMNRITGLSHSQIAEKLGLSIRTVENQVYRASKFLKDHLKNEYLWALFCLCHIFRG